MDRKNSIVVEVGEMTKHPNGDMLSLSTVAGGFTVVMNTAQWEETFSKQGNRLAAYIYPEGVIGSKLPQFDFLGEREKDRVVKAKKIRGIISYGLLTHLPEGDFKPGDCVDEIFQISHYEPPEGENTGVDAAAPKGITVPKYDVDAIKKMTYLFEGEQIVATEKIHGQNFKAVFKDDQIYIGSRNRWVEDDNQNDFSQTFRQHPGIEDFIRDNPGTVIYGESYGKIKGFDYGIKQGRSGNTPNFGFVAFDILRNDGWVDYHEFADLMEKYNILTPPVLYEGVFDIDKLTEIVETDSRLSWFHSGKKTNHIMEGAVIRTVTEKFDMRHGRCQGKLVSLRYWNKT